MNASQAIMMPLPVPAWMIRCWKLFLNLMRSVQLPKSTICRKQLGLSLIEPCHPFPVLQVLSRDAIRLGPMSQSKQGQRQVLCCHISWKVNCAESFGWLFVSCLLCFECGCDNVPKPLFLYIQTILARRRRIKALHFGDRNALNQIPSIYVYIHSSRIRRFYHLTSTSEYISAFFDLFRYVLCLKYSLKLQTKLVDSQHF